MDTVEQRLSPKEAIDAGFRVFREFFAGTRTSHVLLEGLEFFEKEDRWSVTIGFDTERRREKREGLAALTLGGNTSEPIREIREFLVDAKDGSFVRMK